MILSDEDEVLDLVNANDEVVGQITHAEAYDQSNLNGNYLRASNGFIVNSRGELWIPTRGSHKRIAPNGLDYSAGEHVQSGESYIAAMVRGFEEELRMKVEPSRLIPIGVTAPRPDMPPYFASNYIYRSDETPDYNTDDFVSYEWLKPDELAARLKSGVAAKDSLLDSLEVLSTYMRQDDSHQ